MLFSYFITYAVFLLFTYFLGGIINTFFVKSKNKEYESIFSNLVIGILCIVTLFSIIVTSFKTIFVILPIILLLYYLLYKNKNSTQDSNTLFENIKIIFDWKKASILLGVSLLPFLFQYYSLFDSYNSDFPVKIANLDHIFYSKISEYLLLTGEENFWQVNNTILKEFNGATPYHYFSEWIVAFLIKFSNLKSIYLQEIVAFSFTSVLGVFGLVSILEHFKPKINFFDILICVCCLFFKFIVTFQVLTGIEFFAQNSFSIHKVSVLYIFITYSFLQILNKRNNLGFLYLSLMLIFYFVPAVLSGVVISSLLLFKLPLKDRLKNITISIAVILLYGLFYAITKSSTGQDLSNFSINALYVKTFINILGGAFLQTLMLSLPFILLIGLNFYILKIKIKNFAIEYLTLLFLALSIVVSGAIGWAILNFWPDAVQLFQNIFIVVINVVFIILFFYLFSKQQKFAYLTLGFVLCVNLYQTQFQHYGNQFYSEEYLSKIKKIIENTKEINPTGVCLFGAENYKPENYDQYVYHKFCTNTNVYVLGAQLKYLRNYFNVICISTDEIPTLADPFIENTLSRSCFNKYSKKMNIKNMIQAKLNFINEYKIDYVIASKFANIDFLKNNIRELVIDKNTQEKFILLKK